MTVQKGMGFYHVGQANTNRMVGVSVVATAGVAGIFAELMGANDQAPYQQLEISAPTTNQLIAQARMDAVVNACSVYARPVKIALAQTNFANDTIVMYFETEVSQVINTVADISDTLGLAGQTAKTKPGIQTNLTYVLNNKSLDGGTTLLFAATPNLSNGTASTAVVVTALTATYLG